MAISPQSSSSYPCRLNERPKFRGKIILNKAGSEEIETMILGKLGELRQLVIGSIHFDQHLISWGLTGASLESYPSVEGFKHIAEQL